jgi:ribonuclease HI
MAERFRASFDGGSRGNPGPAAWGVVILDAAGRAVEGFAAAIGRATNNVAEYTALLEALAIALARDADDVELLADSELVVKQVRGEYKVKHPDLIPLHAEALRLIASIRRFKIGHVPREQNKDADKLVNRALNLYENGGDGTAATVHETFS